MVNPSEKQAHRLGVVLDGGSFSAPGSVDEYRGCLLPASRNMPITQGRRERDSVLCLIPPEELVGSGVN